MLKGYKISQREDDVITPEETLIDSLSDHDSLEIPISKSVFTVFKSAFVLLCCVFLIKAFYLQVVQGAQRARSADKNNMLSHSVIALRGLIYDANGQPLVENVPILDAVAIVKDLPKNETQYQTLISNLSAILDTGTDNLTQLFEKNKNAGTFVIKENISKEETLRVQALNIPSIVIVPTSQRHYIAGSAFAHVIGYTAKVNSNDLKKDDYFLLNDRTGRLGIEDQYEKDLRGNHRQITLTDAHTNQSYIETGNNVTLTIRRDVQEKLFNVMTTIFAANSVHRGAAIVQNVHTGAVIALVSIPSFDPNIFENSGEEQDSDKISYLLNSQDRPLFDRVISGRYSPGSTIKPLYALAGLKEKVVTPETLVYSGGSISVPSKFDPSVHYTFRDWKVHGWTDIRKAISDSVDIYFYALGGGYDTIKGLGITKIVSYLKSFLADQITGVDLPGEISGFIPTEEWKLKTKGEDWFIGDTYNVSIGQGDLSVTPLWLNTYTSALANGGLLMRPYIVSDTTTPENTILTTTQPTERQRIDFDSETMRIVHEGMRQTVTSGTATILKDLPVPVAAKTGTAQVARGLNSLFTVYGPYDKPDIAMTVLVEDINKSQGLAMRVANDFLMWYFNNQSKQ